MGRTFVDVQYEILAKTEMVRIYMKYKTVSEHFFQESTPVYLISLLSSQPFELSDQDPEDDRTSLCPPGAFRG